MFNDEGSFAYRYSCWHLNVGDVEVLGARIAYVDVVCHSRTR